MIKGENTVTSKGFLRVENFLVLEKAEININKINIIIGPQANGKSIIAKLVSFFNSLSNDFFDFVLNDETKRNLDKLILTKFEERFPRYAWDKTDFVISYDIEGINFEVRGKKGKTGKTLLNIKYNDDFFNLLKKLRTTLNRELAKKNKKEKLGSMDFKSERDTAHSVVSPNLQEKYPYFFSETIFIPASRSFFANLQKNIFTFLASNIEIDPFLKDFGRRYETSKYFSASSAFEYTGRAHKETNNEIENIILAIVKGKYEYKEDQDWLIHSGKRVNLLNASSGQQESLPMLLVLKVWPRLLDDQELMLFIEEPEAHLFPNSQNHILSLLSTVHRNLGTNFFITTHSPYILAALNNLILASEKIKEGRLTSEKFKEMNSGFGEPIDFEDVSAYTINEGKSQSIIDTEYKMVGGDMLDSISEHFDDVMNQLISL